MAFSPSEAIKYNKDRVNQLFSKIDERIILFPNHHVRLVVTELIPTQDEMETLFDTYFKLGWHDISMEISYDRSVVNGDPIFIVKMFNEEQKQKPKKQKPKKRSLLSRLFS